MKFRMPNVEFYLNQRQARGYSGDLGYLSVIWGWNNYQLESEHNFVQWLFPTLDEGAKREEVEEVVFIDDDQEGGAGAEAVNQREAAETSGEFKEGYPPKGAGVNHEAYYLTVEEALEFRRNKQVRRNLLKSLDVMLRFYGLQCKRKRIPLPESQSQSQENETQTLMIDSQTIVVDSQSQSQSQTQGNTEMTVDDSQQTQKMEETCVEEKPIEKPNYKIHVEVVKRDDWKERQRNIDQNRHNLLRITRIMTCLTDVGLHSYAFALFKFYMTEKDRFFETTWSFWKSAVTRDQHKVSVPPEILGFSLKKKTN